MMIPCPLYTLTHLQCPFCGVQRGLLALLHGDIALWWHYNPIVWMLSPYFFLLLAGEIYRPWQQTKLIQWCYSNKVIFSVMGILLVWGIVRNII